MKTSIKYIVSIITVVLVADYCLALNVYMKPNRILDLGGRIFQVDNFKGSGEIRNGIIRANNYILTGSLKMPIEQGMSLNIDERSQGTLTLTGSANYLDIFVTNLEAQVTVRYDTSSISNINIRLPPPEICMTEDLPDGWKITNLAWLKETRGFRLILR